MTIRKKKWLAGLTLMVLLLFAPYLISLSLEFSGIHVRDRLTPKEIELERTLARGPGCGLFWCAGGSIYKLSASSADQIDRQGLAFLDEITSTERGDRIDKGWRKCPPRNSRDSTTDPYCDVWLLISAPNLGNSRQMAKHIENNSFYVGKGAGTQLTIVIVPELEMVYVGWND